MRLLLDTSVVLTADASPARLGAIRDALGHAELLWSPVITWEIAIKLGTGKLRIPSAPAVYAETARAALSGRWLPITSAHAGAVADLPAHHGDPFDRLLIATARVEGLTLATTDRSLTRYDVDVLLP